MSVLTDAERWELEARAGRVAHAQTVLRVAEAELVQARARIVAGYGVDPARPYDIHADGTIVQAEAGDE